MPYRITFFFTDQGDRLGGWSENYWLNTTSEAAAQTAANLLGNLLTQAKASGVYWTATRFSVPGQPRNSFTIPQVPAYTSGSSPIGGINSADYQVTKWLLKMQGPIPGPTVPGSGSTKQWFGGILDASVQSAYLQQSVVMSSGFPKVVAALVNPSNLWSVNVLNPNYPPIAIVSIDPATGIVTTNGAYNFGSGAVMATVIRISRVRNLTYANGLWTWSAIGTFNNQFQLRNWQAQTNVMKTSPKASVRPQLYQLQQILSVTPLRSSNHRVGRPTGLFGGRRTKSIAH